MERAADRASDAVIKSSRKIAAKTYEAVSVPEVPQPQHRYVAADEDELRRKMVEFEEDEEVVNDGVLGYAFYRETFEKHHQDFRKVFKAVREPEINYRQYTNALKRHPKLQALVTTDEACATLSDMLMLDTSVKYTCDDIMSAIDNWCAMYDEEFSTAKEYRTVTSDLPKQRDLFV
eukprot:GFYU01003316.1.p1 GENE.GFYU01003316.1~~GFYU01003316.1.p1  ORF type:complete len:176 (-),score=40.08 GFYU01003316.1:63-590(-)